jgi:prepilin-type processing-associated H-X9-DG protein
VEDAARHISRGGKSLLENPDYLAARARTGNDGPLLYGSGAEVTRNLYPIGLVCLSVLNGFGAGGRDVEDEGHAAGADLLPSMQRLLQYVGHDAIAIKTTPDGLLKTRSVGNPLLSPLTWIDSPIVWIALGVPSMSAAEDAADRVTSASNLRQVGQALLLYSNENKGKAAPDLATLTKTQELSQEALKSPFGPAKDGKDIVLVNYGDGKLNPMNRPNGAELVVAYDQAALEQGEGTNVLYGDGHVDWVTPDVFKKALEESKKKIVQNAQP